MQLAPDGRRGESEALLLRGPDSASGSLVTERPLRGNDSPNVKVVGSSNQHGVGADLLRFNGGQTVGLGQSPQSSCQLHYSNTFLWLMGLPSSTTSIL